MEITKEIFFHFLKDNNFYEGWMEGYDLDNEIYDDIVPLDDFLKNTSTHLWLYGGVAAMAMSCNFPDDKRGKDLEKKWKKWRKKYSELYSDLDQSWMDFVYSQEDKQKVK